MINNAFYRSRNTYDREKKLNDYNTSDLVRLALRSMPYDPIGYIRKLLYNQEISILYGNAAISILEGLNDSYTPIDKTL